jgi:hypothetical protein
LKKKKKAEKKEGKRNLAIEKYKKGKREFSKR